MPQHKSAVRRVRTSAKKNLINRQYKTRMRNLLKKVRDHKDIALAEKDFKEATALLDKLSVKGIIHKNNAANQKSKLAKHLNKLSARKAEVPA